MLGYLKHLTSGDKACAPTRAKYVSLVVGLHSDLESAAHYYLTQHIGMCFEKASVRADRACAQTEGMILIRDLDEAAAMHRLVALMEVKNVGGSGDSSFQVGAMVHN